MLLSNIRYFDAPFVVQYICKKGVNINVRSSCIFSLVTSIVATSIPLVLKQAAYGAASGHPLKQAAPIATSGDNVYIAWWSNKTGNDEVMFKASTDSGKTFVDKMNLSNSTNAESQDAQITAAGNNIYVTWWERNQTSDEPVLRVSNDNGKTFGEKTMLSACPKDKYFLLFPGHNSACFFASFFKSISYGKCKKFKVY
jgi:hypothetical protein